MDNNDYLNFEDAVSYLNTTRSTLYKWLQSGKVPGHKLGRQWRFLKTELDTFRYPKGKEATISSGVEKLAKFLQKRRSKNRKGRKMSTTHDSIEDLANRLILDAYNSGCLDIHLQPTSDFYQIVYRADPNENVTTVDRTLFKALDEHWREVSSSVESEDTRRFMLSLEEDDFQINYQSIETIQGRRITLRLLSCENLNVSLERITPDEMYKKTLEDWSRHSYGIVAIAGMVGSGKTTAVTAFLNEAKKQEKVIFSLENGSEFVNDGINQVELGMISDRDQLLEKINAVSASAPDVVCLGLASQPKDLAELLRACYALSKWTLLVLHLDATSLKDAIAKMSEAVGENIESNLVGVCWQNLLRSEGSIELEYKLHFGKLAKPD